MEWPYIERTSPRGMTDEEWCENSGFNGRVVDGKFICDRPVYIPNTTENYFQTEEELNNNWDVINACCRYPWCGKDDESKSKLVGVQNSDGKTSEAHWNTGTDGNRHKSKECSNVYYEENYVSDNDVYDKECWDDCEKCYAYYGQNKVNINEIDIEMIEDDEDAYGDLIKYTFDTLNRGVKEKK